MAAVFSDERIRDWEVRYTARVRGAWHIVKNAVRSYVDASNTNTTCGSETITSFKEIARKQSTLIMKKWCPATVA